MYHDASGDVDPAAREQVIAQMRALSPLGMTGEASDIALAMLYLASDASRFVTGQLLRVSGGV
jgi:3-oxoacyl-[acyl-carrier protein] reductase